jgi:AraC family transcriptional regulator, regulatory protein of adaptative response / DNA-3-methyladenine glycosylase II
VKFERDVSLRYRAPLDAPTLIDFFARRAVAGVEEVADGAYRRSVRLAGGPALIELRPGSGAVRARVRLTDARDLADAVARCRRLLDLDADPTSIVDALGDDPVVGPSVRARPGLRMPGHVDSAELAIRAVLGQQVSLRAAATVAGRLTRAHGEPLPAAYGSITHLFPPPVVLAGLEPGSLPMPASRSRALVGLARSLAGGELVLEPGADPSTVRSQLLDLPGIGPWTADYIVMRGLGDPDTFPGDDLWIRRALGGTTDGAAIADRWRPYRSYAAQHLWSRAT